LIKKNKKIEKEHDNDDYNNNNNKNKNKIKNKSDKDCVIKINQFKNETINDFTNKLIGFF
jgi:hypothetical protein